MSEKLTDSIVRHLEKPATGNRVTYDGGADAVKGFGVRTTASGAKAFILNYRSAGRERRITIGSFPDWSTTAARAQATKLKRRIDLGEDPMGERHAERAAPDMNALCDRFEAEYLPKRRESTGRDYRAIIKAYIRPELGAVKVADIRHADVERLHAKIAKRAPYRANRVVAVLSRMLNLATKWELRTDNPVRGIERAPEQKRERFLKPAEILALSEALASHHKRTSADVIRFLMLTGCRRGEALGAQWDQFDIQAGVWTKPAATTKQAREHRVPISAPALALLAERRAAADRVNDDSPYVFPAPNGEPLQEIKRTWLSVCKKAGLARQVEKLDASGKPVKNAKGEPVLVWEATARIHDIRHTFAAILASGGASLPIIGAMLGHTQPTTTARYSHLMDDPLKAAAERVGAAVMGKQVATVREHPRARRAADGASRAAAKRQ